MSRPYFTVHSPFGRIMNLQWVNGLHLADCIHNCCHSLEIDISTSVLLCSLSNASIHEYHELLSTVWTFLLFSLFPSLNVLAVKVFLMSAVYSLYYIVFFCHVLIYSHLSVFFSWWSPLFRPYLSSEYVCHNWTDCSKVIVLPCFLSQLSLHGTLCTNA